MKLIIAGRPRVAAAIADAIEGRKVQRKHWIECGEWVIAWWPGGHLLRQLQPEEYDTRWKKWHLDDLPIVPEVWRLKATDSKGISAIGELVSKSAVVVHAGSADREGQLQGDEILEFLGYKGPVQRLLLTDLTPGGIRRSLAELAPNERFRPLRDAALGRQRADWLYGINCTRLFTLLARAGGLDPAEVLPIGRVKTPILQLIAQRERQIQQFVPEEAFRLRVQLESEAGDFCAFWAPADDSRGTEVASLKQADAIAKAVRDQSAGVVLEARFEDRLEQPPLPYCLSTLQIDAWHELGMTAQQTADVARSLFECHQVITFPGDCPHLPAPQGKDDERWGTAARNDTADAICSVAPGLRDLVANADLSLQSAAWDSGKAGINHGIVPTRNGATSETLSTEELAVYGLVARRYLAQFYGPTKHRDGFLAIRIGTDRFVARSSEVIVSGWSASLPANLAGACRETRLPALGAGAAVSIQSATVVPKLGRAPRPFSDDTLIAALADIVPHVSDPGLQKSLRDRARPVRIGAPSTQAEIIEELCRQRLLERADGHLLTTDLGRALVRILPGDATNADMIAVWEVAAQQIEDGLLPTHGFVERVRDQLRELVGAAKLDGPLFVPGAMRCPKCSDGYLRKRVSPRGSFLGCNKYPECRHTAPM